MLPEYFFDLDAPLVVPFSFEHCLYLFFCVAMYACAIRFRKTLANHAGKLRWMLLVIICIQQISQYSWYWSVYENPWQQALPLEMCRVCTILTFLFLLTGDHRFMDVEFYFSPFALSAMVYPVGCYTLIHIDGISYMVNHLMSVIAPLLAYVAFGWRPSRMSLRRAITVFACYLPAVMLVNKLTGGNYFYLVEPPILKFLGARIYFLVLITGTLCLFFLMTYLLYRNKERVEYNLQ